MSYDISSGDYNNATIENGKEMRVEVVCAVQCVIVYNAHWTLLETRKKNIEAPHWMDFVAHFHI